MTGRARIAPATLLQAVLMEAVAVGGGVTLWFVTGDLVWLVLGVAGGTLVTIFMIVLPLMRATQAGKGDARVE